MVKQLTEGQEEYLKGLLDAGLSQRKAKKKFKAKLKREAAKSNRGESWADLAKNFENLHPNKKCGRDRFREVCGKYGVKGIIAGKKPFISEVNARKRLEFAMKYRNGTETEGEATVFLDESKINIGGNDQGKGVYVKCGPNSKEKPECFKFTKKHGGGKNIKFWAGAGAFGVSELELIDGKLTGVRYKELLENNFEKITERMEIEQQYDPNEIVVIQDKDPKHQSKIGPLFGKEKTYQLIDFPPSSPDMNIIENLWAMLKRAVDKRKPNNVNELSEFVKEEWKKLEDNDELLLALVHSMPRRLREVIEANGYSTNY